MHSKVYENEKPLHFANEEILRPSASFLGDSVPMNSSCCLESCKSNVFSSNSIVSSSPAISDSISQVKKKCKSSEITTVLGNFSRTETNLRRSGKYAPYFKFASGTTTAEND